MYDTLCSVLVLECIMGRSAGLGVAAGLALAMAFLDCTLGWACLGRQHHGLSHMLVVSIGFG
jgi:hypothetical protein